MTLKDLCNPVDSFPTNNLNVRIVSNYEDYDLVSADAFLLGYLEDRNSDNVGASQAAPIIREALYSLHKTSKNLKIYDLGDCKKGVTVAESYANLENCVEQLAIYGKPILVFGGTQESICSLAKASFRRVTFPALCLVDAKIDRENDSEDVHNTNYLNHFALENPDVRIIHIANQEYLSERDAFSWIDENNYFAMRLGECNAKIELTEPLTRDAQLVSFDMNSVRYSDNPAGQNVNGLYSEFACQCAWNVGYSPRMNVFSLTEYNPQKDLNSISAQLCAQIIWHVLDGVSQRKNETCDFVDDDSYVKQYLKHQMFPQDICFFESMVSRAMWVEVPVKNKKCKRIVPCSKLDYEQFRKGFVPDFWMREFMRLSK